MRNFDERMAEIKSRSHARVALRRKQILAGCGCCMLCLCIGAGLLWQRNSPQPTVIEATNTTLAYCGKITVTSGGEKAEHSDPALVTEVCEMLESLHAAPAGNQTFTQNETERNVSTTALTRQYIILVEDAAGVVTEYSLSGNLLFSRTSQMSYELTPQQRNQLLRLLHR